MKIRMLTGISGLDFSLVPKEETDRFSDGEAVRLMLSDQAEPADDESEQALVDARSGVDLVERSTAKTAAAEEAAAETERVATEQAAAETQRIAAEAKAAAEAKVAEEAAAAAAAAAASEIPVYADLGAARKAYRAVYGKGPGPSWSIEQIAAKIVEKQTEA